MPTARELLEQADALMRRNREAARTVRESAEPAAQGARDIVPTIVPTPGASTPTASESAPARPGASRDDGGIPVLQDVVKRTAGTRADDDVPVLTDAVHEIDVAAPIVDEGEPSDWMVPPTGDESVLGPSPPSVAVVPPATLATSPAPHREAPRAARSPDIEELSQRVYADHDADVTVRRAVPSLGMPASPAKQPPEIEDLAEGSLADLDPDVTWTRPITPGTVVPVQPREGAPEALAPRADVAPASTANARSVPVGADFDALAEEIRMQVLQRIDMFTDTGLRERLGERLKPIVDRASADLVAAINQHVGEILRAYVAEAIEREIDRWKSGR